MLPNNFEICTNPQAEFSSPKCEFSTTLPLQPKSHIPVGAAESHNMCIHIYHQNLKLLLHIVNPSHDYKDPMKLCPQLRKIKL